MDANTLDSSHGAGHETVSSQLYVRLISLKDPQLEAMRQVCQADVDLSPSQLQPDARTSSTPESDQLSRRLSSIGWPLVTQPGPSL